MIVFEMSQHKKRQRRHETSAAEYSIYDYSLSPDPESEPNSEILQDSLMVPLKVFHAFLRASLYVFHADLIDPLRAGDTPVIPHAAIKASFRTVSAAMSVVSRVVTALCTQEGSTVPAFTPRFIFFVFNLALLPKLRLFFFTDEEEDEEEVIEEDDEDVVEDEEDDDDVSLSSAKVVAVMSIMPAAKTAANF